MTKVKVKGNISVPSGDLGAKRGEHASTVGATFKNGGKVMKAASYFGSATPNASKKGNNPS